MMHLTKPLILASSSAVRAALLRGAALNFAIIAPQIDEAAIKQNYQRNPTERVEDLALLLAANKANAVRADGLIIAADQLLQCDGQLFDKPRTMDEARQNLQIFRGRTHRLIGGAVLAENGKIIWQHSAQVELTMRDFSDDFLETYLAQAGNKILASVGGYQLENLGAHLFEHIAGDYFSILGLPLLPLLQTLRQHGGLAV